MSFVRVACAYIVVDISGGVLKVLRSQCDATSQSVVLLIKGLRVAVSQCGATPQSVNVKRISQSVSRGMGALC